MTEPLSIWQLRVRWNKKVKLPRGESGVAGAIVSAGFRVLPLFVWLGTTDSLPCPTQVVNVSKSVASSWALRCVHFLPGHKRETFTPALSLHTRVHSHVGESESDWNLICYLSLHRDPGLALWVFSSHTVNVGSWFFFFNQASSKEIKISWRCSHAFLILLSHDEKGWWVSLTAAHTDGFCFVFFLKIETG